MHKGVGVFDSRVVTCYGLMNCFVEKGVARGEEEVGSPQRVL